MSIDKNTVTRISKLARIKVDQDRLSDLSDELSEIINWIGQLNEVDTSDVKPLTSIIETDLFKRKDEVNDGDYQEKILKNAPASREGFFVVPKVVD